MATVARISRVIVVGCMALAIASCETGMHARLDDYGRVTTATRTEFCIKPEGRLKGETLCAHSGESAWRGISVGECVHLYVLDPNGKVDKVQRATQCKSQPRST